MDFFKKLKGSPIRTLYDWQNTRWPWAIMAVTMIGLVLVALCFHGMASYGSLLNSVSISDMGILLWR